VIEPSRLNFMPSYCGAHRVEGPEDPVLGAFSKTLAAMQAQCDKKNGSTADGGYWCDHAVVAVRVSDTAADGAAKTTLRGRMTGVLWTMQPVKVALSLTYSAEPGSAMAAAKFQPQKDETYVLLLERKNDKWQIVDKAVPFFPSGCAAQKIKDLKDAQVQTIADKLAAARAATTQPATQPSGK
jgi:hypothetical protein